MKTRVYIDGLNLYYGCLRGTAFKWLDLYALFCNCLEGHDVDLEQVRYYTAPMKASASDDPASPLRQQRYLSALEAYRGDRIKIIKGFMARSTPVLRLAEPSLKGTSSAKVRVVQFTEKQSDVNLAADLISDACRQRCEQAVVCSNDGDLFGALTAVKRDHPEIAIGLVSPVSDGRYVTLDLRKSTHWYRVLSVDNLARSQLPEAIPGTRLTRPEEWSASAIRSRLMPPDAA